MFISEEESLNVYPESNPYNELSIDPEDYYEHE